MAAPTFFGAGSADQSVGAISVPWPAGHQTDDIGILFLETAAQTPSTPAGWTLIVGNSTGTAGVDASTGLWAYWKRAASGAEANVAVSDAGDHVRGRIYVFRGCETSGDPFSSAASDVQASAATAVTMPGITTSVNDSFVIQAVSNSTDTTANQTVTTDWANASLASYARLGSGNHASGNGGGFDVGGGTKATAGAVSAGTTVLATASAQVHLTIALKPPAGGGSPTSEGGLYVTTGVKVTAGLFGATTATLDASSAQARVTIALKPPTSAPPNLPPAITAIPNLVAAVDRELSVNVIITDPENDALTVTLQPGTTEVPAGAVINSNVDGTYDFAWTPTSGQVGQWNIKVRAVDPTPNTTEASFTITVNAIPDPTMLEVAIDIADRARADVEALQALADLVEEHEQMNVKVLNDVRRLIADAQATVTYMEGVITDLEEQGSEN